MLFRTDKPQSTTQANLESDVLISLLTILVLGFYFTLLLYHYKAINPQTHSLGFFKTSTSLCSLPPFSGSCIYFQVAVRGKLISILSTLAFGVLSPKAVPRSCTRLNSTYRPRRICCH